MITIKLPYKTSEDLIPILKQYSSIVRYSYNRFLEGKTEKEVRKLIKLDKY
jgi:predicted transposase